jgi:hypothetical protein
MISHQGKVLSSIAPLDHFTEIGRAENHFIHDGYVSRGSNDYFDDTLNESEWQSEVYRLAEELCELHGIRTIIDLGCGSGHKLVRMSTNAEKIGVDLAPTIGKLRRRYPGSKWLTPDELSSLSTGFQVPSLVISSDVIEHIPNPLEYLEQMKALRAEIVIISTPERNLLRNGSHNGPPCNTAHVREWAYLEFRALMDNHFTVASHFIIDSTQATQCVIAVSNRPQ